MVDLVNSLRTIFLLLSNHLVIFSFGTTHLRKAGSLVLHLISLPYKKNKTKKHTKNQKTKTKKNNKKITTPFLLTYPPPKNQEAGNKQLVKNSKIILRVFK